MYQEISKLLMYGDLSQDEILYKLGQLFEQFEVGEYNKTELVRDINTQVKRILKVATDYGFDDNLWHNYLTFFLMMSENPISITLDEAIELIQQKRAKDENRFIKKFEEEPELEILNGRYGPYIAYKGKNYRIPKTGYTPAEMTLDDCMKLIKEADQKPATKKRVTRKKAE